MEKATLAAYPIPKPRHSHCWGFRLLPIQSPGTTPANVDSTDLRDFDKRRALRQPIGFWIWRATCMALMPEHPDVEHEGATPSQRVSCMVDKKSMAHARECVRLAGLTDDQEVRDQLIALARDWIVAARRKKKKKEEEEEDNDSNVLVFPSAVERTRRHGLRMSLRHAGRR